MKTSFTYEPRLEVAPGIVLRRLQESDVNEVHAYASDPRFTEHLTFKTTDDPAASLSFIRDLGKKIDDGERLYWGVEYEGRIVGTIGFLNLNHANKEMELGFGIAPAFWGQGIINRCFSFLVERAFQRYAVNRLHVGTVTSNVRCQKFVIKEGFHEIKRDADHVYFLRESAK